MTKKIILSLGLLIIYIFLSLTNDGVLVILLGSFIFILYPLLFKKYFLNINYPILTVICFHLLILIIGVIFKGISKTNFIGNFYIIYLVSSYYFGVFIFYSNKITTNTKYFLVSLFLIISLLFSKTLPTIIENKLFFNTYIGETSKNKINLNEITIYNFNKKNYSSLADFNNEIIVVDFWNNNCGVCIEKFKLLNNLVLSEKFDNKIKFISLNIYKKKSEINVGADLFKKQNLNFENFFLDKIYEKKLNINGYPTTIVIKNNKIIFKGTIETLTLFKWYYLK